jgi:quercetin dioxygenase-like cupin family protein
MPTEVIEVGAVSVRFVVEPAQSDGSVAVFEVLIPAQANMPAPHSHDGYEETIYGLTGISTWTIEDRVIDVEVGDAICIPRGAVHAFDNRGEADAKALAIVTPRGSRASLLPRGRRGARRRKRWAAGPRTTGRGHASPRSDARLLAGVLKECGSQTALGHISLSRRELTQTGLRPTPEDRVRAAADRPGSPPGRGQAGRRSRARAGRHPAHRPCSTSAATVGRVGAGEHQDGDVLAAKHPRLVAVAPSSQPAGEAGRSGTRV